MKDISSLLKEAKPLYYKKMRQKKRIQTMCLTISMILMVIISGYSGYSIKSSTNYIANTTENYDIIDSFYPQDEYGLITVAY